MTETQEALIEYLRSIETIDGHEHLMPERMRVEWESPDVFLLFSLYPKNVCKFAGMPAEYFERDGHRYNFFVDDKKYSVEERWEVIWPYLQRIKYTSTYRPQVIALRDIYGIDQLDESTYMEATERIRAANTSGLYKRILRDRCGIKTCLTVNTRTFNEPDPPDMFSFVEGIGDLVQPDNAFLKKLGETHDIEITDFDSYLPAVTAWLRDVKERGAVGLKSFGHPLPPPDMNGAREEFKAVLKGEKGGFVFVSTVLDFIYERAGEWDWPVAAHLGNTGDWRDRDPKHIMDHVIRHPNTRFDLFHLGFPFARDCVFIARNFPNAHLNLCWCYVVSQEITRRTINEILDVVPANKVAAFGGDYIFGVENVYGHLEMARETFAEALAERIARGHIDMEGAQHVARLWFHDNLADFYGLK